MLLWVVIGLSIALGAVVLIAGWVILSILRATTVFAPLAVIGAEAMLTLTGERKRREKR